MFTMGVPFLWRPRNLIRIYGSHCHLQLWYMYLCQTLNDGKWYIIRNTTFLFASWMPKNPLDWKRRGSNYERELKFKKKTKINSNSCSFACLCPHVFLRWFDVAFDLCEMTNVFNAESGDSSCPVVCQVSTDAEWFKQRERGCPGS